MFSSTLSNSPPEIHRGISLDDTPFDIDTFDLDVLLDTASSSNTSSSDSEADEDFFYTASTMFQLPRPLP